VRHGTDDVPVRQTGYTVVAIDEGGRLAALAVQHCQPYPQVRVVSCAFEAWQDEGGSYDLFLAAQAFPWIEPQYGMIRAAELLKIGGTIASAWTLDRSQGGAFWQVTQPVYNPDNPVETSLGQNQWPAETYCHSLRTSSAK
jgi:hypothetical protein